MDKGFPRPWNKRHKSPVPYSSDGIDFPGVAHDARNAECIEQSLCTACGLPLDEVIWVAVSTRGHLTISDPGLMHEKCSKLAELFCPDFKQGNTQMVRYDRDKILPRILGLHQLWYDTGAKIHTISKEELDKLQTQ